jgi:hypothetical protein
MFLYLLYFICSLCLIYFVGNNLHRHGKLWLEFLYNDKIVANKINDVLLLLYRIVNAGYIIYTLLMYKAPTNYIESIAFLTTRLGIVTVALAYLHFQNIVVLFIFSKRKFSRL